MVNDNMNDAQAYGRSSKPSSELKDLARLVGKWEVSGDHVEGTSTFKWMEGGFFLLQRVDFEGQDGQRIKGNRDHRARTSLRHRAGRGDKEPLLLQHGEYP